MFDILVMKVSKTGGCSLASASLQEEWRQNRKVERNHWVKNALNWSVKPIVCMNGRPDTSKMINQYLLRRSQPLASGILTELKVNSSPKRLAGRRGGGRVCVCVCVCVDYLCPTIYSLHCHHQNDFALHQAF